MFVAFLMDCRPSADNTRSSSTGGLIYSLVRRRGYTQAMASVRQCLPQGRTKTRREEEKRRTRLVSFFEVHWQAVSIISRTMKKIQSRRTTKYLLCGPNAGCFTDIQSKKGVSETHLFRIVDAVGAVRGRREGEGVTGSFRYAEPPGGASRGTYFPRNMSTPSWRLPSQKLFK